MPRLDAKPVARTRVLDSLKRGPLTISQMAERLQLETGHVVRVCAKLDADGLIRSTYPKDNINPGQVPRLYALKNKPNGSA